jgi:hypothetical protein
MESLMKDGDRVVEYYGLKTVSRISADEYLERTRIATARQLDFTVPEWAVAATIYVRSTARFRNEFASAEFWHNTAYMPLTPAPMTTAS